MVAMAVQHLETRWPLDIKRRHNRKFARLARFAHGTQLPIARRKAQGVYVASDMQFILDNLCRIFIVDRVYHAATPANGSTSQD